MKQRALRRSVGMVILLVWAGGVVRAQNTPFSSPALDSNCYFPQIGNPAEIDTISGTSTIVKNLGPRTGQYGKMLFNGILSPAVSLVQTGPSFNLHNLQFAAQKLKLDPTDIRFGHFHNSTSVDIFDENWWRIYWANDNSDYDSTRYTDLSVSVRGNRPIDSGFSREIITSYHSYLTSDTVEDLVLGFYSDWNSMLKDTVFIAIFRGGAALASKQTAYEDTSAPVTPLFPQGVPEGWNGGITSQGDFRGVGRDDLIIMDQYSNMWYYRNDPPFQIGKLAAAITQDTLLVGWQNPTWGQRDAGSGLGDAFSKGFRAMRALPKRAGDRSMDFLPFFRVWDTIPGTGLHDTMNKIFIFRGGPDFGSHRLTLDSAAFVIRHPEYYDYGRFGVSQYSWPARTGDGYGIFNEGDMTGSGNNVLRVVASATGYIWDNFYVTGKALDDKIDAYVAGGGSATADTLTADGDDLEDVMMSIPGWETLRLYHGSKSIPVHLNPKWATVRRAEEIREASLTLSPNPARASTVVDIMWPVSEPILITVRDILGRLVQTQSIRLEAGESELHLSLGGYASGVYFVAFEGATVKARAQLAVQQ